MIETLILGLLLFVPLVWTLGVLADLHRGALAASAAAREAGFDAARSNDARQAESAVMAAVQHAFEDQGLDADDATVTWSPGSFERGAPIEVRVGYPVTILQAPLLGRVAGPSVWVRATHVARVDLFRSRT